MSNEASVREMKQLNLIKKKEVQRKGEKDWNNTHFSIMEVQAAK
jgi:hypothetical protein